MIHRSALSNYYSNGTLQMVATSARKSGIELVAMLLHWVSDDLFTASEGQEDYNGCIMLEKESQNSG
jgi:hypothetical protein